MGCKINPTKHAYVRFIYREVGKYVEFNELLKSVDHLYQAKNIEEDGYGPEGPRYKVRISLPRHRRAVIVIERVSECSLKVITMWLE